MRSFTLLELIIVVVIMGILVTFAVPQFAVTKERALDREVQSNLRLIRAAERIYRMESNTYIAAAATPNVNTNLSLSIPIGAPSWNYKVDGVTATNFTGKGQRNGSDNRVWCINEVTDDPYQAGCTW